MHGDWCHCDGKFPSKMMVEMGTIGKLENLEKNWKNLEKLTSGNQNPTFKSGKNRIFSGKNDLKILYQPCHSVWSVMSHVICQLVCTVFTFQYFNKCFQGVNLVTESVINLVILVFTNIHEKIHRFTLKIEM